MDQFQSRVDGDPTHYGVRIDAQGYFDGWAWGENIGWIRFDAVESWCVRACRVGMTELVMLAEDWLAYKSPWSLDFDKDVDLDDFNVLAGYWTDFCPGKWVR